MEQNQISAQGAIEYLLLLSASIIVVVVVISSMQTLIGPAKESGTQQTYDYVCGVLDSNTQSCACYNNNVKNYFPTAAGVTEAQYCCNVTDKSLLAKWKTYAGNTCP